MCAPTSTTTSPGFTLNQVVVFGSWTPARSARLLFPGVTSASTPAVATLSLELPGVRCPVDLNLPRIKATITNDARRPMESLRKLLRPTGLTLQYILTDSRTFTCLVPTLSQFDHLSRRPRPGKELRPLPTPPAEKNSRIWIRKQQPYGTPPLLDTRTAQYSSIAKDFARGAAVQGNNRFSC